MIFTCSLSPLVLFYIQRDLGLTSARRERCRPGAVGSFCFSPWHRGRRISCRWGSTCLVPKAGRPPGCLRSGWAGSRSRTIACLARPAGSTSSACSPGKCTKREQERAERSQGETERKENMLPPKSNHFRQLLWNPRLHSTVRPKQASILDEVHLKPNGTATAAGKTQSTTQ